MDGTRLSLETLAVPAADCAAALRGFGAGAEEGAEVLEIPRLLGIPLWLALLRLRPLHGFWERALRRSRMSRLLLLLPDAWLLDPTPLPPGAVIPRLEIAAWSELDPAAGGFSPATREEILERLAAFPDAPGVLKFSRPVSPGTRSLLSFYRQRDGRVEWLGLRDRP